MLLLLLLLLGTNAENCRPNPWLVGDTTRPWLFTLLVLLFAWGNSALILLKEATCDIAEVLLLLL